jgi:hypothetical protein
VYQTAISIADAVGRISRRELVLPAIQREFVWSPEQIQNLWDSLLRDYPIGSFLFWKVPEAVQPEVRLYDFVTDFDVRSPHNLEIRPLIGTPIVAVLDGQQRLSAINLGLRGSYRSKMPRKRWDNPDAFPIKRLYLRLDEEVQNPGDDDAEYDFRFLDDAEAATRGEAGELWFPLNRALGMNPAGIEYVKWLQEHERADDEKCLERLHGLVTVVNQTPTISHYEEHSDSLDHVLNIFIRVNSGGTQLAFSDLLLSLAIAEWATRDARKAINELQDDMNRVGSGFEFGRDRILKAALVLSDFENIKFRADNFRSRNMREIEERWDEIRGALLLAVQLVDRLGFDQTTLRAGNAVIPLAYYLSRRTHNESYLTADAYLEDRRTIQGWLASSFIRAGYWTGAVDPILLEVREAVKSSSGAFPIDEIEARVRRRTGKTSLFDADEIDELLDVTYGDWRSRVILTLMFPAGGWGSTGSIDHLHPQSAFTRSAMESRGLSAEARAEQQQRSQMLPNLQLTHLLPNQEKGKKPLDDWLAAFGPVERASRENEYLLSGLPTAIDSFEEMFEARRERLRERLLSVLGVPSA